MIVTGTAGVGKSTLCARLAGTISGAVLLDADIHAEDLISVASPNSNYRAFWRSMMRLAHELAQNEVVVVYFATMLPEQALANSDVLGYFDAVHFLCLTAPPGVLRERLAGREESLQSLHVSRWVDFDDSLAAAASEIPTASLLDAGGTVERVEEGVRQWIQTQLRRPSPGRTDSTAC